MGSSQFTPETILILFGYYGDFGTGETEICTMKNVKNLHLGIAPPWWNEMIKIASHSKQWTEK